MASSTRARAENVRRNSPAASTLRARPLRCPFRSPSRSNLDQNPRARTRSQGARGAASGDPCRACALPGALACTRRADVQDWDTPLPNRGAQRSRADGGPMCVVVCQAATAAQVLGCGVNVLHVSMVESRRAGKANGDLKEVELKMRAVVLFTTCSHPEGCNHLTLPQTPPQQPAAASPAP